LQIPDYFTETEVDVLYAELPKTVERDSPRIIFEDNGSIRSIFAPHFVNETYERLSRHKKLVIPSEQLIGDKIYLHQYKVNTKKGLKGDWWEWHQDFPYWHIDDGIEQPAMVSVMLYLQDTDSSNGALLLIPKTHKLGIVQFAEKGALRITEEGMKNSLEGNKNYLSSLNANLKFTVDHALIKDLSTRNGIVTASGRKGSVLFFHGNIFHASNINLTPFDRDAVLITYNSVHNAPCNKPNPRPAFLAGRDYNPIETLEASILTQEV